MMSVMRFEFGVEFDLDQRVVDRLEVGARHMRQDQVLLGCRTRISLKA